jgi:hypothetical protein
VVDLDPAVLEQLRELAVDDRGPDLGLDVVADDRKPGLLELPLPFGVGSDEDRDAVDDLS